MTPCLHQWVYHPALEIHRCAMCPKVFTREMAMILWGPLHDFASLSHATLDRYAAPPHHDDDDDEDT